jgi:hypothetical protein
MTLNHSWRSASLRIESKSPQLQSSSFMISLLISPNDGYEWLNRLVVLAPKTLILPRGLPISLQPLSLLS